MHLNTVDSERLMNFIAANFNNFMIDDQKLLVEKKNSYEWIQTINKIQLHVVIT